MKPDTQRLLLVGTTRAPSKEVLQKVRTLLPKDGSVVMIANPAFNFQRRMSQFFGAQDAYRQGGIRMDKRTCLEELPELAAMDKPPAILLGGGCPYTLLDEIDRLQLKPTLETIARKSLLIGACAGAIALSLGTQAAFYVDEATKNTVDIDLDRKRSRPGLGMVPFDYLSASTNTSNPLSCVPDLMPLYLRKSGSPQIVVACDGAGVFVEKTPGATRQEFLGNIMRFVAPLTGSTTPIIGGPGSCMI